MFFVLGGDSDDVISSPHVNHKANGLNQDEDDMVETPPEPPEQHTEPPYEPVTIGLQMREVISFLIYKMIGPNSPLSPFKNLNPI